MPPLPSEPSPPSNGKLANCNSRHRLVKAVALCAIVVSVLLMVRTFEPGSLTGRKEPLNVPSSDPRTAAPTPFATPDAPAPSPTPLPSPDPSRAAAAHGTTELSAVGTIRFTCVRIKPDGTEESRRTWSLDTGIGLVTAFNEKLSYLERFVPDQIAPIDSQFRADSIWLLLPFRLLSAQPDAAGQQLFLDAGGPHGESAWLSLSASGLIEEIELGRRAEAEARGPRRFKINQFLVPDGAPEMKLPAEILVEDGSRIFYEEVAVDPAALRGEVEIPEPWPSVEEAHPAPAPADEGG